MEINKIKEYAKKNNVPIMMDEGLQFILEYIKNNEVLNILELGTAIGYSSICMANLNKNIKVTTLEIDYDRYKVALENINQAGLASQIEPFNINIDDYETNEYFDLIFVDAAKSQYGKYLERFTKNLSINGCMIFDNLMFHGIVDNLSLTRSRSTRQLCEKIFKFRESLIENTKYNVNYYENIGDGIAVVSVKNLKM